MIDFKKKINQVSIEKKINPIDLYNTLDRKTNTGPLRPTQERVLTKWFKERRTDKELIIKLNTGAGKTLIGLLLLQSLLNDGKGPCLYVCPNKYLVKQVCEEAEKFGIPYCVFGEDGRIPLDYTNCKKIMIIHSHKIFNGKTIFRLDNNFEKAGAVVLDDSHSCIDTIKDAYTIQINKNDNLYGELFELFHDDLREQGEGTFLDIKKGSNEEVMMVPYWVWFDRAKETTETISRYKESDSVKFAWELLKDEIINCSCFISGNKIEITHNSPSIKRFGTFYRADYKILMSATTQDDSFFVKGLFFSEKVINNPLVDEEITWSGEKMIIFPSAIGEQCDRDFFINGFSEIKNENMGVVSIVPSRALLSAYEKNSITCVDKNNAFDEIKKLKDKHFEKPIVLLNKYDGVDLPDESCRVLILDSRPNFDTLSDRYEENCRYGSEIINKRIAQKIEQGLGRSVRGEKDYSVIIIIGNDIEQFLRNNKTKKLFSPQTIKQIEIGEELSQEAVGDRSAEDVNPLKPIYNLIDQVINRDEGWKEYYTSEMDKISKTNSASKMYTRLEMEAQAEECFCRGDYKTAVKTIQQYLNDVSDKIDQSDKGWYLQQLARYKYFINKEESKKTQETAHNNNDKLLKIHDYNTEIGDLDCKRMEAIIKYINEFGDYGVFEKRINKVKDMLKLGEESERFECALYELGCFLGFDSTRPDKEEGTGPDNMWESDGEFLCFECKSEMKKERRTISKKEIGQMSDHVAWFKNKNGKNAKVHFFFVAPTNTIDSLANCDTKIRVVNEEKLGKLKDNVSNFIREICQCKMGSITVEYLQNSVNNNHLNYDDFEKIYSVESIKNVKNKSI